MASCKPNGEKKESHCLSWAPLLNGLNVASKFQLVLVRIVLMATLISASYRLGPEDE